MKTKFDRTKTLEMAERQVKAGRIEEAIAEYRKLLADEAPDLGIHNIIGDLYVQLGRNPEAVKSFQTVAGHYESRGFHSQALAIYKKINKIDPEDVINIVRMGDLFCSQGFMAEARREYLKAEQKLRRDKRIKELMFLYDKLIKLDHDNIAYKLTLAELFRQEGFIEEAVGQLNDAAALHLSRDELGEAEKIVEQARWLKPDDQRTMSNLVEILKKGNRRKYAIELVDEILEKDPGNVQFQNILGSLYLEERQLDRAEDIFIGIVSEHPLETKARIKLGKVYAIQDRAEKAFELFEPLIASLIKKQKEDKAIGLLGIVLSAEHLYLPALETLAAIYKAKNHKTHLEVVNRVILEEARRKGQTEKMFVALAELLELRPRDKDLIREYRNLRKDLGFVDEKTGEADTLSAIEAEEEDVDLLLARVDLYVSQGLVRNARRILENLNIRFPRWPKIEEKIASLDGVKTEIRAEDIQARVGKVQDIEAKIEATPDLAKTFLSLLQDEESPEKRMTSADIFADTEILPLPTDEAEEKKYYNLDQKVHDEIEMLQGIFAQQIRGDISILEKELTEIVSEFRDQVRKKVDTKDYETRFNLGLAYLEQGLIEEAIEEFLLASEDPGRALDCYSIISKAYKQNNNFAEARTWLEKSMKLVKDGSAEHFALLYELASLHEDNGERVKALEVFQQVKNWNPKYRDVKKKISTLS
ncbi:MAG: tetratricopeptide repeat protein [Candidatus Aminicenantes bacterium]|nr:tetratricopeptide repeat protein [Candidatus Aminicenantes bacterium]